MAQPRKLSPSELSQMMSSMSPQRATRSYNKCMTNPDTPQENLMLLRQYRDQNLDRFLSEDQMRGNRGFKGSWTFGKGFRKASTRLPCRKDLGPTASTSHGACPPTISVVPTVRDAGSSAPLLVASSTPRVPTVPSTTARASAGTAGLSDAPSA